jgi:hypothetical protein
LKALFEVTADQVSLSASLSKLEVVAKVLPCVTVGT